MVLTPINEGRPKYLLVFSGVLTPNMLDMLSFVFVTTLLLKNIPDFYRLIAWPDPHLYCLRMFYIVLLFILLARNKKKLASAKMR